MFCFYGQTPAPVDMIKTHHMIFSSLTTPNWLSRWCPSTWWCPCLLNAFRSWFRTAHSSELYKATAPNVSYYDASTVNVQSNPTIKAWMVSLAYLGRDLWELLLEFMKLCVMGQLGDLRNSARHPNLTLLWRREISWLKRLIAIAYSKHSITRIKIDLHYAGRESWVRWAEKNSQRVHEEVNCTKMFYLASCWNTILLLGQSEGILGYRNPMQVFVGVLKRVFPYEFHCATAAMALTEHGSIYFVCRFLLWIKEVTDVP